MNPVIFSAVLICTLYSSLVHAELGPQECMAEIMISMKNVLESNSVPCVEEQHDVQDALDIIFSDEEPEEKHKKMEEHWNGLSDEQKEAIEKCQMEIMKKAEEEMPENVREECEQYKHK